MNISTIFQSLDKTIGGGWGKEPRAKTYDMSSKTPIYTTNDRVDYEKKKLELKQQKYLSNMWVGTNKVLTNNELSRLNELQLAVRDSDIMDNYPEIAAALDTYCEEACTLNQKGEMIQVYSTSERIKSIIQDLLINRLEIQVLGPMIIRSMAKYGNTYMLLNITNDNGIVGWRMMPVGEVTRVENGIQNPYSAVSISPNLANNNEEDDSTKFIWQSGQQPIPYRNWQVGHFRLLNDSKYLPYGVSILDKARRHFRILTLMEDMMLIYRLERSIERRVYKIYVGAIDDADVSAYIEDIANNFKRTPIVDPTTGQIDLRKNILQVDNDVFIPVRDPNAPNPIDTLSAGSNLTAIDDIKFIQNKVLAGLRIPRPFLNFDEVTGEGKNLALMDIRFTRVITRIQQAFLLELNKIVTIHLYLMGFKDDLNNFSLTMNSPSTQAEQLEIDNLQKKISAVRDAVSDPGNGIPVMSLSRALKEIMKWSDSEIKENFEEIRLEKALAAELEKTSQIIKRTKIFDTVDKVYGEPGAEYQEETEGGMPDNGGPMGGGGGGPIGEPGGSFGDDLEGLGEPGGNDEGAIKGDEGTINLSDDNSAPNESYSNKKPLLTESLKTKVKANSMNNSEKLLNKLVDKIMENKSNKSHNEYDSLLKTNSLSTILKDVDDYLNK